MILTMVLLFVVYVLFIVGLVAAGLNIWLVLVRVSAFALFSYFSSDKIAMFSMGAREASPQQEPDLHARTDRLSAMADIAKPGVGLARSDALSPREPGPRQTPSV